MLTTHGALYGDAPAEFERTFHGPRSILLIEDEPDLREILAMALERVGYTVATASNGWEALQFLYSGNRPALVLSDLHMPVMSGWRFIEHLHADPDLQEIPVVVMSASGNKSPGSRNDLEDIEVVAKPFEFMDLLEKIRPFVGPIHISSELLH
jgi:CheY-like chemotaxis protein